jgi:hypothetical protein
VRRVVQGRRRYGAEPSALSLAPGSSLPVAPRWRMRLHAKSSRGIPLLSTGWPCSSNGQGRTAVTNGRFRGAMAAARLSATTTARPPITRIEIMHTRHPSSTEGVIKYGPVIALCRVGYEVFHTVVVGRLAG